jgi:hypothetical protein
MPEVLVISAYCSCCLNLHGRSVGGRLKCGHCLLRVLSSNWLLRAAVAYVGVNV